jgi:ribosome-associated toxin RatA of RatAB toxin-antitoxin module
MPHMPERPFSAEEVLRHPGPLIRLLLDERGEPAGALVGARVEATPARLWTLLDDVESYGGRVPMVHRVERDGDRLALQLRFRIALFSVGFAFDATVHRDPGRRLELRWIQGEPRNAHIRYELDPLDGGKATLLHVAVAFDIDSLGWLAKYFLKHHPEIRFGVLTGAALTLLDAMQRAATGRPAA